MKWQELRKLICKYVNFHNYEIIHSWGIYKYLECPVCNKRVACQFTGGYGVKAQWWLDHKPKPKMIPPKGVSSVRKDIH
jgi:hypothetical protein